MQKYKEILVLNDDKHQTQECCFSSITPHLSLMGLDGGGPYLLQIVTETLLYQDNYQTPTYEFYCLHS